MPYTRLRRRVSLLLGVTAALSCSPSQAQRPADITAGEMARLPKYCAESQTFATGGFPEGPLPSQKPWIALMGREFWAIHHYCWALVNANRSAAAGVAPQLRDHLLTKAIGDCEYVIQNAAPDFVLLPEIYLRVGEYHERLGRPVIALENFERSRRAKSDYWPAYLHIADLQTRLGNRAAAADALTAGLEQVPGQPQLQAALDRLKSRSVSITAKRPPVAASGAGTK